MLIITMIDTYSYLMVYARFLTGNPDTPPATERRALGRRVTLKPAFELRLVLLLADVRDSRTVRALRRTI